MSNIIPDTENIEVSLASISWEIVRIHLQQPHEERHTAHSMTQLFNETFASLRRAYDSHHDAAIAAGVLIQAEPYKIDAG